MLHTKHCFGPKAITLEIGKVVNRCFADLEIYMPNDQSRTANSYAPIPTSLEPIVTRIARRIGNGSYPLSHVHRSALILFNTVGLSTIR